MKVGVSILIDFYGVSASEFHDAQYWVDLLDEVIQVGCLHKISIASHQFQTQHDDSSRSGGATVFALLAESHISVHTWPEFGEVLIDIFTCGADKKLSTIVELLKERIPHEKMSMTQLIRGESC